MALPEETNKALETNRLGTQICKGSDKDFKIALLRKPNKNQRGTEKSNLIFQQTFDNVEVIKQDLERLSVG